MGCDIHAYIEYQPFENQTDYWWSVGHIHIRRDYLLFGVLAGVRWPISPVVEPRGVPDHLGFDASDDYWEHINETEREWREGYVNPSKAAAWLNRGDSVMHPRDARRISNPDWHTPTWLTVDELAAAQERYAAQLVDDESAFAEAVRQSRRIAEATGDEDAAFREFQKVFDTPPPKVPAGPNIELAAIIAAMRELPRSRLVCWFDN